jgi:hypothetical protein
MRSFFGKPIRDVTEEFHPEKLTLEEFQAEVVDAINPFVANMKNLGDVAEQLKHIEEWYEQFLAWSEVEQKPD